VSNIQSNGGVSAALPQIRYVSQIPDSARGKGRVGGGENVYQKVMIDMPAPAAPKDAKGRPIKDAPVQFASFFVPCEIPATITDPAEREKAAKDQCAKLANRFTSMSRRIRKNHGDGYDFTFRKARDPDATDGAGAWGIVVYRIEPGTVKAGPPRKVAA
jgi:hypothetical protein